MVTRHDLVWLSPQGWEEVRHNLAPASGDALEPWQRANWPAVVRRCDTSLPDQYVSLGVPLPPQPESEAKLRIAFKVSVTHVVSVLHPLRLNQVLSIMPAAWRNTLTELDAQATALGIALRVYGSFAMQALTGMSYVTAASDLDLLFYPSSCTQLDQGLALLASCSREVPLDGEIVFPTGQAVAWKEWWALTDKSMQARVLVKQDHGVKLATVDSLLSKLETGECPP